MIAAGRPDDLQLDQILEILLGDAENCAGLLEFEFDGLHGDNSIYTLDGIIEDCKPIWNVPSHPFARKLKDGAPAPGFDTQ